MVRYENVRREWGKLAHRSLSPRILSPFRRGNVKTNSLFAATFEPSKA